MVNMPNNKRKRDSIARIEKVFIELLQVKELDKISVSEICQRAGLNRTTFYANYLDVYDLADSIRDTLEHDVAELYGEEIRQGFNSNNYLKLFQHIKDNQLFYQTYFKLGYDNNYAILRYDTELAREHFHNEFIDYHMEFFKAGITRIIKMWLANGCQESPEDMQRIILSEYQGRETAVNTHTENA